MAYYYEIGFYGPGKETEKSLKIWGEGGFTWYLKSEIPLTDEEVLAQCIAEHQSVSGYQDMVEAIPYCDCINQITGQEFEDCCGVPQ